MKKVILALFAISTCVTMYSQSLQTTIKVVNGKARIVVKAVGGPITGQPSNFIFVVGVPAANGAATLTATSLDPTRLPTALNSSNTFQDAEFKYYNLTYTGPNGSVTFADGVEYELIQLNFSGPAAAAPVSLLSLPDGNPGGIYFNYLEVGGIGVTDPATGNLFYDTPGSSTVVTQATDYSTGRALITTNGNITLPVNILNFSGYKNDSKNTLHWTTANEQNNVGFDVQRSTDGSNYTNIGFVNTLAPGGNSTGNLNYSFDDLNPAGKKQYYRLNQKDLDGRTETSRAIIISGDKPKMLTIGTLFPNPAKNMVNVIIDAPQRDEITLVVVDLNGKTVKQQLANVDIGSNTVPVELAGLAKGNYVVKAVCKTSDCETAVGKFTKL